MVYLISAKITVLVHVAFVVFVFFGGLLASRFSIVPWLQVPCVLYAVVISVVGWSCPLTILEQALLRRAGAAVYSGEFLPHYLWSRFGLSGSELPAMASLLALVLVCNFVAYRRFFNVGV